MQYPHAALRAGLLVISQSVAVSDSRNQPGDRDTTTGQTTHRLHDVGNQCISGHQGGPSIKRTLQNLPHSRRRTANLRFSFLPSSKIGRTNRLQPCSERLTNYNIAVNLLFACLCPAIRYLLELISFTQTFFFFFFFFFSTHGPCEPLRPMTTLCTCLYQLHLRKPVSMKQT